MTTDFRNALVKVNGPDGPVGVGFVVGPRSVVTCHHVLDTLPGVVAEGSQVSVTFFADGRTRTADVVIDAANEDVVVLRVPRPAALPARVLTLRLTEPRSRAEVALFGFPEHRVDGSWNESSVSGLDGRGRLQLNSTGGTPLQPGFSGTPVIEQGTGHVVGMLVETSGTGEHGDARAVPTSTIRSLLPPVQLLDRLEPRVRALRARFAGLLPQRGRAVVGALVTVLLAGGLAWWFTSGGLRWPVSGDCVTLHATVSTEKDELVGELAEDFKNSRGVGQRCVHIEVTPLTSGIAADALANGWQSNDPAVTAENRPDVWLPTSTMSVDQVAADSPDLVPDDGRLGSVTSSVLAIAVPTADKDQLFPEDQEDWDRLRELSENPAFTLGRDNPHDSTSGLAATVAAYYAGLTAAGYSEALGSDPDWAVVKEHVDHVKVGDFVHEIEQSVDRYEDEATAFMKKIYDQGTATGPKGEQPVNAVVVQEQLIHLYNCNAPEGGEISKLRCDDPPERRLTAVYPEEGSVELNHPFVVLGQTSPDSDVRAAAAAEFYHYLKENDAQEKFMGLGFRRADDAKHPTSVLEESLSIPSGQELDLLPTPPADVLKWMLDTWEGIQTRTEVTLVVDVSNSMDRRARPGGSIKIDLAEDAAKLGVGMLTPLDGLGITEFSDTVRPILPVTDLAAASRLPECADGPGGNCLPSKCADVPSEDLRGCVVDTLKPGGNTALYDAVTEAFTQAHANHKSRHINAVVVLSDGKETVDEDGLAKLLEHLRDPDLNNDDHRVQVYTVAYGADAETEEATGPLQDIATASGGKFYDATDADRIGEVMVDVFANFGGDDPES